MDETAGTILTINISKSVYLRELHSFMAYNNDITLLGVKLPKNRQNKHFCSQNVRQQYLIMYETN